MRYSAIDLLRLIETAEPVAPESTQSTIQPHSARYCSDLASPLLKTEPSRSRAATTANRVRTRRADRRLDRDCSLAFKGA
jgi:hypothetical protein